MKETMTSITIPPGKTTRFMDNDGPEYFAVLQAAWRHPDHANMPHGAYGRYHEVDRDEPLANEFRAYFHIDGGMRSIPLGSDRDHAEMVVQALNQAYNFGLLKSPFVGSVHHRQVQVGRMGHRNRGEENMP